MSSLVVGGVPIKVAVSSPRWTRSDAVDRARAFDNTFRASQTGGAVRVWDFETPAVLAATEGETYKAALSTVASQLCSGDILALPTMCSAELTDGVPTSVAGEPYVVLSFSLHEVQPAKVLLRYAPGNTITGESFTRSTTATYYDINLIVQTAAINAKRDSHYTGNGASRGLLLEDARTNGWSKSQEFDHADWIKQAVTVTANATTAPDGTTTADKIVESALTTSHAVYRTTPALTASTAQATSVFAKAAERTWTLLQSFDKAGVVKQSWVNLSTGVTGTVASGHTVLIDALASSWYRITVQWDSASGASAPEFAFFPTTGDGVVSYLGDITKGIYLWGAQIEVDKPFASSYIPTTTGAVARGADFYSLPFTTPPQEMSAYLEFKNLGTPPAGGANSYLWSITNAAGIGPELVLFTPAIFPSTYHSPDAVASVTSALSTAPATGDTAEIVSRLFGDGSVDTSQSLNGAAVTSSVRSAALSIGSAWIGQLVWLNSAGTLAGFNRFQALKSFKIVAGSRSLQEMRSL